jgi:hypothetical protein
MHGTVAAASDPGLLGHTSNRAWGGTLYLSTSIGREQVIFNANLVFDPSQLLALTVAAGLKLQSLTVISPKGEVAPVEHPQNALDQLASQEYQLGLFELRKP